MRFIRRTTHLVAGLACAAALTACGIDQLAEEGLERAIEEGASGEVDVDFDDEGGISVDSSDGSFQVGSRELPEGFPADEVPMIDGEILASSRIAENDEEVWSVTLLAGSSVDDAFTEARDGLTGAGFEETHAVDTNAYRSATLEGDDFRVQLTAAEGSDGTSLSYMVFSGTE